MTDSARARQVNRELASYFARYGPKAAKFAKALRARLRKRLPGLFEVVYVYESQDALVISYSPTENGYEGLCSLALYPNSVKLFFGQGARLSKADPNRLLRGGGKLVRHVVLGAIDEFERPEIEALIAAALKLARVKLEPGARGAVVFRVEAQKQRTHRSKAGRRTVSRVRSSKSKR